MNKWNYYFSGILYGVFQQTDDAALRYAWRNSETGQMGPMAPLDEEKSEQLLAWSALNPYFWLTRLGEVSAAFARQQEEVQAPFGRYSRRETGLYVQRDKILPTDILLADGQAVAFICPARNHTALLVKQGFENSTVLKQWQQHDLLTQSAYGVHFFGTFMVPMRDGVNLSTDVYLPEGAQWPLPTVLARTPYNKKTGHHLYFDLVQRGYAVVLQDVRGREASEGEFVPNLHEVEDGDDTLNWIAAQPFSNGKVGMTGASYLGYVQWAAGASGNPHLAAMVSMVTAGSAFSDIPRRGGCFVSGMLAWAFMMAQRSMDPAHMAQPNWDELLDHRPLEDIPRKALGYDIPFLNEWLARPNMDNFWKRGDWKNRWNGPPVPALIQSGWFDDDGMGTTEALDLTQNWPDCKVILGPWNHNGNSRYDIHGYAVGNHGLRYDLDLYYLLWLDRYVKGIENGVENTPRVEYFTLGEDCWKTADAWPLRQGTRQTLYLQAEGALVPTLPEAGENSYLYNPNNPATHIVDMSENELEVPEDYTEEEKRADILCYTTPPLEQDLVLTGDVEATLYVSSSAVDTDFVVRITDVDENGRSIKLADGMLCAKYREGFEQPAFLQPGQVYPLQIRTTKLSNRFFAGHRMRVTVTSSAKNFTFPNSNTQNGYNSVEVVVANNTVHCGGAHASHIVFTAEA